MRLGASPEFLVFLRRPDQHVSLFPRTHICVGGSCLPQQIIKFKVTGVVGVVVGEVLWEAWGGRGLWGGESWL